MPYIPDEANAQSGTVVLPSAGWMMNQRDDPSLQSWPSYPLLYGIDGRYVGALRRFRGFRRLDYDIREYTSGSYLGAAQHGQGATVGDDPVAYTLEHFWQRTGPHDWDGFPQQPSRVLADGVTTFNPDNVTTFPTRFSLWEGIVGNGAGGEGVYGRDGMMGLRFKGVTISRPGGLPPLVGFVIHTRNFDRSTPNPYDPAVGGAVPRPMVKFLGRPLGYGGEAANDSYPNSRWNHDSCMQCLMSYWQDTTLQANGYPYLDVELPVRSPRYPIEPVGVVAIGRSLFLTHPSNESGYYLQGAKTHAFLAPFRWRPPIVNFIGVPDIIAEGLRDGYFREAPFILAVRTAGIRDWTWFGQDLTPPAGLPQTFSIRESLTPISTATTPHEPGAWFQVKARFVNLTTGFIGPWSDTLTLSVPPSGAGGLGLRRRIQWMDDPLNFILLGARGLGAARALWGVDNPKGNGVFATPVRGTSDTRQFYDVRLQFYCTQSSPPGGVGRGLGVFHFDHEIQVYITPNSAGGPYGPGPVFWLMPDFEHTNVQGVPALSNAELAFQDVADPEFDTVLELQPGEALGDLDGILVSLDAAERGDTDDIDITRGDIRVSPPWAYEPVARLETTAPYMYHRVLPKSVRPVEFMRAGSVCLYLSQNKTIRMRRDGSIVRMKDTADFGPTNREAADATPSDVFFVTDQDVIQMNVTTEAWAAVAVLHRLIAIKWRLYASAGRMMAGYDPQLNAVFVAPRPLQDGPRWERRECAILWLTTGRVTMLHDIYWVGMTRGTHPVNGKEYLFFVDPAQNIYYADTGEADRSNAIAAISNVVDPPVVPPDEDPNHKPFDLIDGKPQTVDDPDVPPTPTGGVPFDIIGGPEPWHPFDPQTGYDRYPRLLGVDQTGHPPEVPATMTGINQFRYPNLVRVRPTLTITITDYAAASAAVTGGDPPELLIDGVVYSQGLSGGPGGWDITGAGDANTCAENLRAAIEPFTHLGDPGGGAYGVRSVARVDNVVTLTGFWGLSGQRIPVHAQTFATGSTTLPGITISTGPDSTVDKPYAFSAGEAAEDHSQERWGGRVRGYVGEVVTLPFPDSGLPANRIRVVDEDATLENNTFDRYSWFHPWATDEADSHKRYGALVGSQVYFFTRLREVSGPRAGEWRTVLVADGRVSRNEDFWFDVALEELNLHTNPMTGQPFEVGDVGPRPGDASRPTYTLAPVVVQVVGAPLEPSVLAGLQLHQRASVDSLGFAIGDQDGYRGRTDAGTSDAEHASNDAFVGVATQGELQRMGMRPLRPGVERATPLSEDHTTTSLPMLTGGYAIMPTFTHYGTNSQFDLLEVFGRVSAEGESEE